MLLCSTSFLSGGQPVSPSRQTDIQLGSYAPSAYGDRPTSAPSRRSVTFAEDHGEANDLASEKYVMPTTAPEKRKPSIGHAKLSSIDLGSSLDESVSGSFKRSLKLGDRRDSENVGESSKKGKVDCKNTQI